MSDFRDLFLGIVFKDPFLRQLVFIIFMVDLILPWIKFYLRFCMFFLPFYLRPILDFILDFLCLCHSFTLD